MSYYNLPERFRLETRSAKALQSRLGMKLLNAGSLELWPLRACFARLYNFSLPRDYRIPARLGLGSLWLGELRLRANNGAWKERSSHLKETASTGEST